MKTETKQRFLDRLDFFENCLYLHIENENLTDDIIFDCLKSLANLEIVLRGEMSKKLYDRFYEVEDQFYAHVQNKDDPRFRRSAKTYGRY